MKPAEQLDLELEDDMIDVSDDEVEFVNETFAATEGLDVSDEEVEFTDEEDDDEFFEEFEDVGEDEEE